MKFGVMSKKFSKRSALKFEDSTKTKDEAWMKAVELFKSGYVWGVYVTDGNGKVIWGLDEGNTTRRFQNEFKKSG